MGENDRVLAYKIAREHFENNNDHAAVAIFESCQRSSCKHPIQEEELEALSVTADLALCRFRAAAKSTETNAKFLMDVSYHEAICANNHLRTRLRQCHDHARLELCLLAAISAVWIHTKMDNLRMARHIVWDTLQWAASNLQPADTAQLCCLSESLVLLSQSVQHQVLRKFRHVLDVLDLVQGKDLSLLIGKKCSVGHIHDKLVQQERAVMMLARRRLGLLTACSAGAYINNKNLDIACKLQQILRAIDEPHAQTDEDIAELRATIDHVKSSDLNLLGHFQSDCQLALTTYTRALKCLQPSEVTLECEIAFNIADCLSRLGFHNQAKALFLWLYEREDRAASTNVIAISPKGPPVEPKELLWKAFVSATLDNDVVSTLAIADSLHSKGPSKASELALAFSLHQAGRPSQTKRNFTNESQMYWAFERDQQPEACCDDFSAEGFLSAWFHNNRGIVLAGDGQLCEATLSFEKACKALVFLGPCYLHPYYNLTLLLWNMGNTSGAVECWAKIRGLLPFSECEGNQEIDLLENHSEPRKIVPPKAAWIANNEGGLQRHHIALLDSLVRQYFAQQESLHAFRSLIAELSRNES